MNISLLAQWPGDAGILQTVHTMREMVNRSFLNPMIRERAAIITAHCERNKICENQALLGWVNSAVQYTPDPSGVEALHDPVTFYEARIRKGLPVFGDCDDMSIYLASLLKSIGHRPRFRVLAKIKNYSHILVICDGQNLDASMSIGLEPKNPMRAYQVDI